MNKKTKNRAYKMANKDEKSLSGFVEELIVAEYNKRKKQGA